MAHNPDWPRVKEIFHGALERGPEDRLAFVHASCDQAEVRVEVERLLAAHEEAGEFIERSPVAVAGRVIDHYKVEWSIGAGGMGEVYRARDLELGREVAIKIAHGSDADSQARLKREAQHASQLNHPNICTIHEVGESGGAPFIVMELVEGDRLADLISRGTGLATQEIVRYGLQMASALEHAHQHGVIHRDLKSANVMVTRDGRIKVLDFGLARRHSSDHLRGLSKSRDTLAAQGVVAGTLSAMAPELLRGGTADARSDIWALGVLLYEMAAGTMPFAGATGFELSGAILHEAPAPLRASIPDPLRGVIARCLEKNPAARYQSASDIRVALEASQEAVVRVGPPEKGSRSYFEESATPSFLSRCWRHRIAWAAAVALAVVAFTSYRVLRRQDAPVAVGASGRPAIAVMSFENAGGQQTRWLSQGVPSMLLTGLAQTRGLDIVSTQRLREAGKQNGVTDLASLDPRQVGEIAKLAGAGAVVIGSIYQAGEEIRIDARVEDLATGRVLAADTVRGADVFVLVDRLAASIRRGIGVEQIAADRGITDVSTASLEAYRAYAEGTEARNNFRFEDAGKFLDQAVAIDPGFAEAHLELAAVSNAVGRPDSGMAHLRKATEHRDRLGERERLLLRIESARANKDFSQAARALDQLVGQFPDADVAYDLAAQLYHPVFGALPSVDKALEFGKAGVTALPLSTVARQSYAMTLFAAGRNVDALREFETYARIAPRESEPFTSMALTYQVMGLLDKALDAYDRARRVQPDLTSPNLGRAWTLAMMGRYDEALTEIPSMEAIKALFLSRVGRYREAQQLLDAISTAQLKGEGVPESTHVDGALLAIERKAYTRALAECDAADRFRERLPEGSRRSSLLVTSTVRGVAEARSGKIQQAIAQLGVATRAHQPTVRGDNYYRVLEGEIALARGELDKAAEAFAAAEPPTRAFQYSPGFGNNPPFRDGLARVAAAQGDRRGAVAIYRRLLIQGPDQRFLAPFEPLYVLEIARLLDQTGDKAEAVKEYERFLQFWRNADAGLPELAEARRAVTRLRGSKQTGD